MSNTTSLSKLIEYRNSLEEGLTDKGIRLSAADKAVIITSILALDEHIALVENCTN